MGKFAGKDVLFFVDGYNLIVNKLQGITFDEMAEQEDDTGLGDDWEEHSPTGHKVASLTQEGAFFDDATNAIHDAMSSDIPSDPDDAERIIVVGVNKDQVGAAFFGYKGAFSRLYKLLAARGGKQKADVEYSINGPAEQGVILQPLAEQNADWDTESTPVDGAAQSSNGGTAYLQVTAVSGFTNFVATVVDSADDVSYGALVAFPDNVSAPYGARATVAGTVERYLAMDGNVTGTGTISAWCGFARNP